MIFRFDTAPNDTLAVVVKLTTPVALLTVKPVSDPSEVTFGCAAVVNAPPSKVALNAPVAKLTLILVLLPNARLPVELELTNVG